MNIKTLTTSCFASSFLIAASPMVSTSMSTDNGGAKKAIDAYSDGAGVLMINQVSDTKFDNSAMNKLVFKYGDAAKTSNTTIKNQVNVLSPEATTLEKLDATSKLEFAKIAINPPLSGTSCDDGNANTTGDVWTGSTCAGVQTVFTSCLAIKTAMPSSADGTYTIDPDGASGAVGFPVYCDMTTNGGGWTRFLKYQDNILRTNISNSNATHLASAGYKIGINFGYTEVLLNNCGVNTSTSILINIPANIKDEWIANATQYGVIPNSSIFNSCNRTVQRKEGGTWYYGHNNAGGNEFETVHFATTCVGTTYDSWSYARWGAIDSGDTSFSAWGTVNGINNWNTGTGPYRNDLICAFVR